MAITSFTGKYRFLSNFWIASDGSHVEGQYQMEKCANPVDRLKFAGLGPGDAKRLGRRVRVREDWDAVRLDVMFGLVWKKFAEHEDLLEMLLETGKEDLIECNTWGDRYFGVVEGYGCNHLGKILTCVRRVQRDVRAGNIAASMSVSRDEI